MKAPDDGHGPSYGCTYQACGNPMAVVPCPFVKDDVAQQPVSAEGRHEHHYALVCPCGDVKAITPHTTSSNSDHDITTVANRGERWFD